MYILIIITIYRKKHTPLPTHYTLQNLLYGDNLLDLGPELPL